MRENFTSGSVGRAPGNRCLYLEADALSRAADQAVGRGELPRQYPGIRLYLNCIFQTYTIGRLWWMNLRDFLDFNGMQAT